MTERLKEFTLWWQGRNAQLGQVLRRLPLGGRTGGFGSLCVTCRGVSNRDVTKLPRSLGQSRVLASVLSSLSEPETTWFVAGGQIGG